MPVQTPDDDAVVVNLKQVYDGLVPGFDVQTEGTPEEDIFVKGPVFGAIGPLWDRISDISLFQSYDDVGLLAVEDLDEKLNGNTGFPRKQAQASRGSVTFYGPTLSEDITIPSGVIVSTESGVQFRVNGEYIMYSAVKNTYFDFNLNLYSLAVPVIAVTGGTSGNVKAGKIVQLTSQIPGITSVTNVTATSGGAEQETNEEYVARYKERIRGTTLTSYGGMLNAIDDPENEFSGVTDRVLVKAGSALMLRDEGLGGMVDIYILGSTLKTVAEQFFYSEDEDYVFKYHPVDDILSVSGAGVTDPDTEEVLSEARIYEDAVLVQDRTSTRAGSYLGQDYLTFNANNTPIDGELVTVTYTYNELINNIQAYFNDESNSAPNSDILIKESLEINFAVTVSITVDASLSFTDVADEAASNVAAFVNALRIGENFTRLDIANQLGATDGVANASLNDITITSTDDVIDENGDTDISAVQHCRIPYDSQGIPSVTVLST